MINNLVNDIIFIFERLNWLNLVDLFLVTLVFFVLLKLIRDTQAMVLLRGALLIVVLFSLLTSLDVLPAFSWVVSNTLPALLLAVPVIFAPEIRRTLERLGRAGTIIPPSLASSTIPKAIPAIVSAVGQLSEHRHGALIVIQRMDNLAEYVRTGVKLNALVTPELLLQVFYPNTPLHDGAVIISGSQIIAAACVMPLSASGVLTPSPDRHMGLRHRASLGISEVSDAVAVVVSEETGNITVVHGGRMIRRLDLERLENVLRVIFSPLDERRGFFAWYRRLFSGNDNVKRDK
ncbi:MAG: diadenylate cyclase CdaA [Anaerolineales bacterium]|nr:diadenylate cyclase CdaA [Anaerolineales bacterium]